MVTIKVTSLDVWGHHPSECEAYDTSTDAGEQQCWDSCGGYQVNNWFDAGTIELPDDFTDEQLLNELIASGYIKAHVKLEDDVVVQDIYDGETFDLVDNKTGEPLYQFLIVKENES